METRTYNVYAYDELPKEAKEKAIQRWIEHDDLPWLEESLNEYLAELLHKNKIKADEAAVQYSLSYCQGDGAMFTLKGMWKKYHITVKQSGHYYHYNSKDIFITDENDNDAPEAIYNTFNDLYVSIAKELAKAGYKYIEDSQSEESVAETFRANEYMFTLDGKID